MNLGQSKHGAPECHAAMPILADKITLITMQFLKGLSEIAACRVFGGNFPCWAPIAYTSYLSVDRSSIFVVRKGFVSDCRED